MAKNSSFLPEDYLDRKIARRTNLICIALFLVMIGAISAAFYVQKQQDQSTRHELARVDAQFSERAEQLRQIEQLQDQKQQMIGKAKIVQQLVERVPRSIILAEMINHMPQTLSLLELNLETKILKPGSRPQTAIERDRLERNAQDQEESGEVEIVPREIIVEVVGVAPNDQDVSVFMENLTNHPLYVGVGLEYIERTLIEGTEMRRFRIVMRLNMDLTFDRGEDGIEPELRQNPMAGHTGDHEFLGGGETPDAGNTPGTSPETDPAAGVSNVPTQTD